MGWKTHIFGENQEPFLLDQRAIRDELFALGYYIGVAICRGSLLQDCRGTLEYDEAVRCALNSCLGSPHSTEELPAGLRFRGLSDG